jgi:hypothetical protein
VLEPELPPLPPLPSGPPAGWAASEPDEDPGWELGRPPPAGGDAPRADDDAAVGSVDPSADTGETRSGFDDVMKQMKDRPTFKPRPPAEHPQARALRGDPLGGLTLEPPPGGALDVTDDDGTGEGA